MFYVRVATRSSGSAAQGSPRQALGYLADNHDRERDAGCSEAEFNYIARLDPGWKTDLEGGRGPLVGYGTLKGVTEDQLVSRFEDACQPHHDTRGSTGYKSLTFTLPKEVSLFAEGHREEAKAAMHAAVQPALDRAFPGMRYSAAAAIHTRNTTGEIHYHVHVVVAKFAQTDKGRTVSLNSKAGGNGPLRLQQLKRGWKEGIEREFRERLQLGIEQRAPNGPVTLVLPDRARLEPLNRNSRRLLEKEIAPRYTEPSPSGAAMVKQFRWSAMDDRIFEVASGDKGDVRWSRQAFAETFPEHASHISRYEARVRTLQAVGYLSPEGKVTPPFRVHFCVHHGVMTPELQRVRLDLQRQLDRERKPSPRTAADLWSEIQSREALRRRVHRLGIDRAQVDRIYEQADKRKPTKQRLDLVRATAQNRALKKAPSNLPRTKTIIRAYLDLGQARAQRVYLLTTGVLLFWRFSENKALAQKLLKTAERDLFYAKEKRIAQVGWALRPVFWMVRVAMPRQARRLSKACERCIRLAQQQESRQAGRDAVRQAYLEWRRDYVDKPLAELHRKADEIERQAQKKQASPPLSETDLTRALTTYRRGVEVLNQLRPNEAAHLRSWKGADVDLVAQVVRSARGEKTDLAKQQYDAAVKAGRIGHLLEREATATPLRIPDAFAAQREQLQRLSARMQAFGLKPPFAPSDLGALSPSQLKTNLGIAKRAGLLEDGPDWTLKAAAAREVLGEISLHTDRARQVDQHLHQNLTKKQHPTS